MLSRSGDEVGLTQLLPLARLLPPPPLDDLNQLICSLADRHEARRLVDLLPSEIYIDTKLVLIQFNKLRDEILDLSDPDPRSGSQSTIFLRSLMKTFLSLIMVE